MRAKGATFQKFLLGAALLSALAWNLARASEVEGVHLSTGATGTRAEIVLDSEASYSLLTLAGPDRLVVDLPGVELRAGTPLPAGQGLVRSVRTGHPVPGTTRIVFDLAAPVAVLQPRMEAAPGGHRLVLVVPVAGPGCGDEAGSDALRESLNRVSAMSTIHELLYRSNTMADIDFAEVLRLVIDLGRDNDTVACVAGGLAGGGHLHLIGAGGNVRDAVRTLIVRKCPACRSDE